ncbi:DUF4258 domain-containing protein [Candidatus Bathyarchaeota archaeon]|nr:DUF4258 domain-containing protein [Candidatus Bathyarchaeota archaeon]
MRYTKHGKLRATERGITESMILKTIKEPTNAYYDLSTSITIAFKKLDGKHLLVAYSKEKNEIKIVTTFITSNAQEIIKRKLKSNIWVKIK